MLCAMWPGGGGDTESKVDLLMKGILGMVEERKGKKRWVGRRRDQYQDCVVWYAGRWVGRRVGS